MWKMGDVHATVMSFVTAVLMIFIAEVRKVETGTIDDFKTVFFEILILNLILLFVF